MKDALEYINKNHTPLYKKLNPFSHGGENIRFGPPRIWNLGIPFMSIPR